MQRQLIFVHGRSQENKDAGALKREWIEAWSKGLDKAGLALPLDEADIRSPYYGDTLALMASGKSAEEAARIVVRSGGGLPAEEAEFVADYLDELQAAADITDDEVQARAPAEVVTRGVRERGVLNWGWVQALLEAVDQRVPLASGAGVALFTQDVYRYLRDAKVRKTMNDGVRGAFTPGRESIVVSHSLGTVVAYDVLRTKDVVPQNVPLFMTLGSPLGVKVVRKSLQPVGHPAGVGSWFNAMDERDVVALFPLRAPHFGIVPAITNKTNVDNPTANRHGISGYLSDPEVARRIHEALVR
jgi:hypothetical protein